MTGRAKASSTLLLGWAWEWVWPKQVLVDVCDEILAEEAARAAHIAGALDDIARPAYALNALDVGVDAALGSLRELVSEWDAGDDRDRLGTVYDALAAARAHALAVANGQASLTGSTP